MEAASLNPGFFPLLILILWVPVAIGVFAVMRPSRAVIFVMLFGALFLPERVAIDGPLIPPLGKHQVSSLCSLLGLLLFAPRKLRLPGSFSKIDMLMVLLVFSAGMTVLTNPEPLINGPVVRQGLGAYDVISTIIREAVSVAVPFILGRVVMSSSEDMRRAHRELLSFGMVYSILELLEVRVSPQLHRWVYGYHAHSFAQTMRGGGYRPTVFMEHGLAVGLFAVVVLVMACVAARNHLRMFGLPAWLGALYLAVVLVLVKSTGALVIAAVHVPAAFFLSSRAQVRLAAFGALLAFAYPITKATGAFPAESMVELAMNTSAERAQSLKDRFDQDIMLIDHANNKKWFGWGGFARHRILDSTGKDISVTDGYWIIQYGVRGAVGLFGTFGLLLFPLLGASRAVNRIRDKKDRLLFSSFCLVLIVYVFDLLPNGLYNVLPFFIAGGITSLAIVLPQERDAPPERPPVYA